MGCRAYTLHTPFTRIYDYYIRSYYSNPSHSAIKAAHHPVCCFYAYREDLKITTIMQMLTNNLLTIRILCKILLRAVCLLPPFFHLHLRNLFPGGCIQLHKVLAQMVILVFPQALKSTPFLSASVKPHLSNKRGAIPLQIHPFILYSS